MVSRGVNSPGDLLAGGQKVELGEGLVAAVMPEVEAPAMRRGGRIRWRHHQAVRCTLPSIFEM